MAMLTRGHGTRPISVNETIDRLAELAGQTISVYGALSLEFESTCINHIPKTDRRENESWAYKSSIWVNIDQSSNTLTQSEIEQFDGRHVLLVGNLIPPKEDLNGCGHFSMWPAELDVTSICKY